MAQYWICSGGDDSHGYKDKTKNKDRPSKSIDEILENNAKKKYGFISTIFDYIKTKIISQ